MDSEERTMRAEKVKTIFNQFDKNKDGGLDRQEMSSLVISVNPKVHFSNEQIDAILDEVFRTYEEFIDGDKGLTFEGLLRTYDDGAGDVDRDFKALDLELALGSLVKITVSAEPASSSSSSLINVEPMKKDEEMVVRPSGGVGFGSTGKVVEDLEGLIKRLKGKQLKEFDEPGWSSEIGPSSEFYEKRVNWEESGRDYSTFVKELGVLRSRVDENVSKEEAFDGHMAIGKLLYENQLFKEALVSFKKSCELQPMNCRPHFRAGNCLYVLGKFGEGKEEFLLALEAAEGGGNECSCLLPQIHVNLGICLEGEGMVLSACEHYREAAHLCPTHFRALKLLGSALFGVGEYRQAEKVLEETILLKSDYSDAHCDLGSTLHGMGEDDRAIQEFQRAIDLKPGHVDALYNLGGLYMDMGRYQRASDMYGRVLAVFPNHWRAQLNKAVALLGAGEDGEARKALKEAFKMTNRVELHDAIAHLKHLRKKQRKEEGTDVEEDFLFVESLRFKRVNSETTRRGDLANALEIRDFQRLTRLGYCNVDLLKKEMTEMNPLVSYSGSASPEKYKRKAALEKILRRLLHFLKPETFQGAVKAINRRILCVLDSSGSARVDLGMFYAVLAPICSGPSDKRKQTVLDALQWNQGDAPIRKFDVFRYIKLLRAIYLPNSEVMDVNVEADDSPVSFSEFLEMFDDPDWGFGIMDTLVKLETGDRTRHCHQSCSVCRYPILGSRFKEMRSLFSLCSQCYSEGKVPSAFKQEDYTFIEYENETEAIKDKCTFLSLHSRSLRSRSSSRHDQ